MFTQFDIQRKYDENNNIIYRKNNHGDEEWMEYDKNNNLIHYRTSAGFDEKYTYNDNNKLIKVESNMPEYSLYYSNGTCKSFETIQAQGRCILKIVKNIKNS